MIRCPKCGGAFASPNDLVVHEQVNPRGIWYDDEGDHTSQCEANQRSNG